MRTTVDFPDADTQKLYKHVASERLKEKLDLTREAIATNSIVAGKIGSLDSIGIETYECHAQIAIASAFIHSWIYTNPCLNFNIGKNLKFEGDTWGVAFGAGVVWMIGTTFLPPEKLIGRVQFQFSGGPMCELSWWKDGVPVGGLLGGGLAIHGGSFGGDGTFSWC